MAKRKKKRMAKHPRPVKGKCPPGYHKGKTKKTKDVCVRTTKRKRKYKKRR